MSQIQQFLFIVGLCGIGFAFTISTLVTLSIYRMAKLKDEIDEKIDRLDEWRF